MSTKTIQLLLTRQQIEKILGGKYVSLVKGEHRYNVKLGNDPETMVRELKLLQEQVYGYRAENKKLKEKLVMEGYTPSEVANTNYRALKQLKPKRKGTKKGA